MSRMIIENRTDISDLQALDMVSKVVEDGRVSGDNDQYCDVKPDCRKCAAGVWHEKV